MKLISAALMVCGILAAQAPQTQNENAARMAAGDMPVYRATVTERTAKAVNYQHRSGATKIDFAGTSLMPKASGEAKVESKQGYMEIEVEFDELQPANRQGSEYLTYVLWAISPEGRTSNLGEILLNGTRSKLNVTTELQVFGLVVTAEPYYCGHSAERSDCDGKRGARGHEGEDRGDRRQVRTAAARANISVWPTRWR